MKGIFDMVVLTGDSLRNAIKKIVQSPTISCAVAFWGRGALELIGTPKGRNIRLVCNLKMGGTNPFIIQQLLGLEMDIKQHDRLHAKIYINDDTAIITSANLSINGLGLEGNELAGWLEAGVKIKATEAIPLFEKIWNESRTISNQDIIEVTRLFNERKITKPSLGGFANFELTKNDFPLIDWVWSTKYKINSELVEQQVGRFDKDVEEQIDWGLQVQDPSDVSVYKRGLWVLHWPMRSDGLPHRSGNMYWTCSSGKLVKNAYQFEGEEKSDDVILAIDPGKELFDIKEKRFKELFKRLISSNLFSELRETEYEGSFFTQKRKDLMWKFWQELKLEY